MQWRWGQWSLCFLIRSFHRKQRLHHPLGGLAIIGSIISQRWHHEIGKVGAGGQRGQRRWCDMTFGSFDSRRSFELEPLHASVDQITAGRSTCDLRCESRSSLSSSFACCSFLHPSTILSAAKLVGYTTDLTFHEEVKVLKIPKKS